MPDDILMRVSHPIRYLDGEPNAVHKDHAPELVKFLLAYPDVYEVGMSNLGLRLLYGILNRRSDALCERVFSPWPDMEAEMRRLGLPLFALESGRPAAGFDFFGLSLQYELTYTNILNLLDLAGLPLLAADRRDGDPLVIGGGPCAFNPEPLAPFFDLIFLGEAEEAVGQLVETYAAWKRSAGSSAPAGAGSAPKAGPASAPGRRGELLEALARIPGVYVPAFYDVTYNAGGTVAEIRPTRPSAPAVVTKRAVKDLSAYPGPVEPIIPYLETIHDRAVVEVMRGCSRGCRFCQAGMIYRPVRERTRQETIEAARRILANTGYEELSLTSLSTCDWGPVAAALGDLVAEHGARGVGISLPSLRTDTFAVELAAKIQEVRKTGLTFAPEAGTSRLRAVINKGVTREDLLAAAGAAFAAGWDRLKLYYMIGLPTETDEDLAGIGEETREVRRIYEQRGTGGKVARRPLALAVSLATFIPKAHTPFQWEPQVTLAEAERRVDLARQAVTAGSGGNDRGRHRRWAGVKIDWHSPQQSRVEAVLARGDRRVHQAIFQAWKLGARFDGWTEHFDAGLWDRAFAAAGIDPEFFANRARPQDEVLPWSHLSGGVEPRFLRRELEKALAAEATPDCRWSPCTACGVCQATGTENRLNENRLNAPALPVAPAKAEAPAKAAVQAKAAATQQPVRWRLRLCYAKTGRPRFVSHLDFVRLFERAARRAGLPLAYSEGFSPAPRIAYGWPLAVGMAGLGEYVDVELKERTPPERVVSELNSVLPEGIEVREARYLSPHGPSLMAEYDTASYMVHLPDRGRGLAAWRDAAAKLLAAESLPVTREKIQGPGAGKGRAGAPAVRKVVEVRPLIRRLEVREVSADGRVAVFMELAMGDRGAGRPDEVAGFLVRALGEGKGEVTGGKDEAGGKQAPSIRPEGMAVARLGFRREGGR